MGLGDGFEIEVQNYFRAFEDFDDGTDYKCFRVVLSGGAVGSTSYDPNLDLEGDVIVNLPFIPGLKVECKHHKSETKEVSFRIQKSWFDKITKEAEKSNRLAILALKFKNYSNNATQFIISKEHFTIFLKHIKQMYLGRGKPVLSSVSTKSLLEELEKRLIK